MDGYKYIIKRVDTRTQHVIPLAGLDSTDAVLEQLRFHERTNLYWGGDVTIVVSEMCHDEHNNAYDIDRSMAEFFSVYGK